jgi:hypothetical protein
MAGSWQRWIRPLVYLYRAIALDLAPMQLKALSDSSGNANTQLPTHVAENTNRHCSGADDHATLVRCVHSHVEACSKKAFRPDQRALAWDQPHNYIVDITMTAVSIPAFPEGAGAPDSESEITPAMVEAGMSALRDSLYVDNCRLSAAFDLAKEVIRRALAVQSRGTA